MTTPAEAAQEVLDRRAARKNLIAYTRYTMPGFEEARHHRFICQKLEEFVGKVLRKESPRLMIFEPPRHTKTELVSKRLPAWFLGQYPEMQYMSASYNDDFASDIGREVRNIFGSQDHLNVFPGVSLRADSKAANRWHTSEGGIYVSIGVGGAGTGRGAHIFGIDDPFKDWAEASSETIRNRKWDWFTSVVRTRMMPGGGIIVTHTRWSDDDIAGRLLKLMEKGGEQWDVISLPAIALENDQLGRKPGEALWPEWYGLDALAQIKSTLSPMQWNALYQQNPIPEDGDYFKTEHCQYYEHRPKHLRIYGASDFAVTDGGGDFTEHGVFGLDPNDDLYILDWWYGQTTSDVWIEEELDLIKRHKPVTWYGEGGVIRRAVEPTLIRRSRERRIYCDFQWLNSITDKPTRARGFQARWSMRKVYVPADTDAHPWVPRLLRQLSRFPAGAEDDGVDVCSLIGRALDDIFSASAQSEEEKKARNDYAAHDEDDDEDGWKTA
jgi:predicted phage terminase large subunit-like protein